MVFYSTNLSIHFILWLKDNISFYLSRPCPPLEKQGRSHLVSIKGAEDSHHGSWMWQAWPLGSTFPSHCHIISWVNVFVSLTTDIWSCCWMFLIWDNTKYFGQEIHISFQVSKDCHIKWEVKLNCPLGLCWEWIWRAVEDNNGKISKMYPEKLTFYRFNFLL